jgi:hypothetical protein
MKATILFCAAALLIGCAHYDNRPRGRAPAQSGLNTGSHVDSELPYRTGPGLPSTDQQIPPRAGPADLGAPE